MVVLGPLYRDNLSPWDGANKTWDSEGWHSSPHPGSTVFLCKPNLYRCGNVASVLAFDDNLDRSPKYFHGKFC